MINDDSRIGSPASKFITRLVDGRWGVASADEAVALAKLMVIFNNHHWWKYTAEAEKNKIVHADIILDHLEEIEDSWCNGLADWDGTIIRRQYSDKAIARQKNALKAYLAEFGNELSYGEVELVRDAQLSIKP